jgi:hypothetical protein
VSSEEGILIVAGLPLPRRPRARRGREPSRVVDIASLRRGEDLFEAE